MHQADATTAMFSIGCGLGELRSIDDHSCDCFRSTGGFVMTMIAPPRSVRLQVLTPDSTIYIYAAALLSVWFGYSALRLRADRASRVVRDAALEAGLFEPASLHPLIDPIKCLGCGACLKVCPEGDILGMINGRAELIEPTNCIGHGACKTACPRDAISLVFGTATRGVDIPFVGPDFQTNVKGLFIAGELGGMGLIRNAIEQGCQAVAEISRLSNLGRPDMLDLVIVGGGPAGFAASLAAIERKLRFVTVEQDSFGGTVAHFPRGKLVMTAPAILPIVGRMNFKEVSKETLLAFWGKAAKTAGLKINYGERVEGIASQGTGFTVTTSKGTYRSRAVLLATGRRGTPRRLDVGGEEQSKVVYRLVDPEQYRGQHVLVVGGGDSALEAAASIAEEPGTTVTLSYRSDAFSRAKPKNRARFDAAVAAGRLTVMLSSKVMRIGVRDVEISWRNRALALPNDAVIVCAGGILPTAFLKSVGIEVETKYGTA
jgi:thioredoxin reductase (NADPH)